MDKLKISAVSYLNTKPFLDGLNNSDFQKLADVSLDTPARIADKLTKGKADIGLVPVAAIEYIPDAEIISDFCIACNGSVQTVCIFSEVPIHQIKNVILDYQSRTSVQLTRILFQNHWNLSPQYIQGSEGYESTIDGDTAGLIIGDRAIHALDKYPYVYDLGAEWEKMTGLPFVFAVWVSTKELRDDFLSLFNKCLNEGLENRSVLLEQFKDNKVYNNFNVKKYLTEVIDYRMDADKLESMKRYRKLFLNLEPSLV